MKFIINGKLDSSGKVVQDNSMFNACVMVNDTVVGQSQISTSGEYQVEFDLDTRPETVDLKIVPSSVKPEDAGRMALTKKLSNTSFSAIEGKADTFSLVDKFYLPIKYLDFIRVRTGKYHVHGTVYLEHETYFTALPGCRIDFYEVDYQKRPVKPGPGPVPIPIPFPRPLLRRQDYLGSAYTRVGGSYEFDFRFGSFPLKRPVLQLENEFTPHFPGPHIKPDIFIDLKPDIQARFFLYINGEWTKIYSAPMLDFDWNIDHDYHRDYQIPADAAVGAIEPGVKPATGFRFKSIGLIPIDTTRIVDGYIHSQPGDPLANIIHEPLCGSLRIHGLFANVPAVTTYLVERLMTDATGTALTGEVWTSLEASLKNQKWNESLKRWVVEELSLGGGRYKNIDIEDPLDWLESSLKGIWNTTGLVNGYYILRITGYDSGNTETVSIEMPMICVDNDVPQASIDIISPAATICGDLTLGGDRTITFDVTAYEADGHLHSYYINGSRGRYGEVAGPQVYQGRPVPGANWNGIDGQAVTFAIAERSTTTIACSTMAYSFHLCVQGGGTDGSHHLLQSKRVWRHTNLVVSE